MNFICREEVLAILQLDGMSASDIRREIEALPFFPAPDPEGKNKRNVMGQTEEEFWARVET